MATTVHILGNDARNSRLWRNSTNTVRHTNSIHSSQKTTQISWRPNQAQSGEYRGKSQFPWNQKTSPLARNYQRKKEKDPQISGLVGATEVNRDTTRDTALIGIQHEVHLTAASAYVETDEGRRTANTSSEKEVTAEHSQGTPEADHTRSPPW